MVVFDSSVLLLVLYPAARPPNDPDTGQPLEKAAERIEYLIEKLTIDKEQILVPTPVLSEVLVHAGDALQPYLNKLDRQAAFKIVPFDRKAAIEAALSTKDAIQRGGKGVDAANPGATGTKIKFDRQIVAIARAQGAHTVYSDDADIHNYATYAGLKAKRLVDLDMPP
ncbi:MAG: type II toxin-antitoxin system VapC family toxin [Hyphomonadaceae bacterium]|nr:type II toxin-antitoxin system VapC family toxin [Hyphomonadaceae bacterium]